MSIRRTLTSPFRRGPRESHPPERLQFQVVLSLAATEQKSRDELEDDFTRALETLIEEARGVVFGPVGGVDFTRNTLELEFTVAAISPAVLYAKMGEVLRVLEHAGFEWEGSREERLGLELQPA